MGRDILSRLIYGARISLTVILGSACISAAGGSVLGLVAGYRGGWIDRALVRLTGLPTAISSIRSPWGFALIGVIWFPLVFSILVSFLKPDWVRTLLSLIFWPVGFHIKFFAGLGLVATFGPGLFNIVLALAILGVLGVALMVRNSILATHGIRREAAVGVDVEAAASLANQSFHPLSSATARDVDRGEPSSQPNHPARIRYQLPRHWNTAAGSVLGIDAGDRQQGVVAGSVPLGVYRHCGGGVLLLRTMVSRTGLGRSCPGHRRRWLPVVELLGGMIGLVFSSHHFKLPRAAASSASYRFRSGPVPFRRTRPLFSKAEPTG